MGTWSGCAPGAKAAAPHVNTAAMTVQARQRPLIIAIPRTTNCLCRSSMRRAAVLLQLQLAAVMAGVLESSTRTSHVPGGGALGVVGAAADSPGGRSEWVMRQLRCLRTGSVGPAALAEDDFHLAQAMLLQELRSDDACPVCLEHYDSSGSAVLDGCGHSLCVGCAAKWAASSASLGDSTTRVCAIARTHVEAITCPLCNHIVSHFYIRMHQDGSSLSSGAPTAGLVCVRVCVCVCACVRACVCVCVCPCTYVSL